MLLRKYLNASLLLMLVLSTSACKLMFWQRDDSADSGTDDGGSDDDDSDSEEEEELGLRAQGNYRVIFVTTGTVNGTGVKSGLGDGVEDFDALCAEEAEDLRLGGVFKALVSSTNRVPNGTDWVIREGKEYRREDLTTVIEVAEHDNTVGGAILSYQIADLENPITATARYPWTGFGNDWTTESNCQDWTRNDDDNTSDTFGTYGKSSISFELVDIGYASWGGGPLYHNGDPAGLEFRCNKKHPVYCVQTKQPIPSGPTKRIFKTNAYISGSAGWATFDNTCSSEAVGHGLTGTYKAIVSAFPVPDGNDDDVPLRRVCSTANCTGATGMEQAVDWALQPNMQYVWFDDSGYINKTNAHGFFDTEFEESLPGTYWTGVTNTWVIAPNYLQCLGWSESGSDGMIGTEDNFSSGSVSCTSTRRIFCAEQ